MERADRKPSTVIVLGILLACCPCAFALDPSLDISQYAHTAWTIRDGFFKGVIYAIAQTPDGYLWLGTEFGLLRFDGVRSVPWQPPVGERLPSGEIGRLLAARDGRLWIGTNQGLASWKDGKLTHYPELDGRQVLSLIQDREGTIWVSDNSYSIPRLGQLCMIRDGAGRSANAQCYGADGSFGSYVGNLYEDSAGSLWAAAGSGLWRWKPGPPKLYPVTLTESSLLEGDSGALWVSTIGGMKQLVDGRARALRLPGDRQPFIPRSLFRDRDGGVWIGTGDRGLLHVHRGRTDLFARADGLSGDLVLGFFEDREGDIWVATANGLDRFRDFAIPTISRREGLSDDYPLSVLAAGDSSVWVSTLVGLNRMKDGQVTIYRKHDGLPDNNADALFQDARGRIWVSTPGGVVFMENGRFNVVKSPPGGVVHAIAEDREGDLWFNNHGLFRVQDGRVVEEIPWARLGREDSAISFVPDSARGGLWLGFFRGGVAYFKNGQIRASYAAADGLGGGRVAGLRLDGDGTLWASTQGGLSRVKDGRVSTLSDKNGLPCNIIHWSMEDDEHSFWLYTACGLLRIARTELDAWSGDPKHTVHATVFDNSDGVRVTSNLVSYRSPRVEKSADGRLWFAQPGGVSVIDPRHLAINKLPPPVHIEEVKVDGKVWDSSHGWRLPALVRGVTIHYTALSLAAAEKVHFRYKLEGQDADWKEVVNDREAQYTNLKPRNYRFRVMACNNSGVWNEAGDFVDFSIAPAYYQTTWFLVSCVGAFSVFLWGLYRYRLYQLAREFNANLEGRVDERLRVARDLHDTLLQSFHGLLPRLQAAVNLLPGRASDARQVLEAALDDAAQAITEARDAVQGMRSSATTENDLATAIEAMGQELAARHRDATGDAPAFSLEVEGFAQDLHPILRDEIYRIASEALRNAFHHAQARIIEVEIRYDPRQLRVRLRDDGIGIDADVLRQEGREGHFGFRGMRERAKGIGGKLEIWSEQGAGTEVELIVPASVAYAVQAGRRSWLFRSKVGTNS